MKYRRLEVENFRPFYGRQVIDFSTDPQRPVTLIYGANGGGKTSLLTAMWWCLYNNTDVDPNTSDNLSELFNLRAKAEIPAGGSASMSVELELVAQGTVWRIRRSYTLAKDETGNVTPTDDVTLTEIQGDVPVIHRDVIPYRVNQLLDKKLAPFFFHAAEMLQFPFDASRAARERLRDCVFRIVGQSELDALITQAGKAQDKLRAARQTITERAQAHSLHEAAVARLDGEIEEIEREIESKKAEIKGLEPVLTRMLGELRLVEAYAPLADELKAARDGLEAAKGLETAVLNGQKEKTKALWMIQAKPLMASFFEWFEPRAVEFPRIVNQNLILHMEQTGKCICGHDVGPAEIATVKALMADGDDEASRRLTHLFDLSREWDGEADLVRKAFEVGLAAVAAAEEKVSAAKERLREAEEAVEGAGKPHKQDPESLRKNVADKSREKSGLEGQIESSESNLAGKTRERAELMKGAMADASDDLKLATAKLLAAGQVVQLASSMKDIHAELCRPALEEQMNLNYWVMKPTRMVRVDEDWLVDTYDQVPESDEFSTIGGGGAETTLLTYAFAAATAKLIPAFKGMVNDIPDADRLAEAETYPLVVDAPFSSLGNIYQKRVTDELPEALDQLILFNEATHLTHFAEMSRRGLIGKLYSVKFTGPLESLQVDDTTFEFAGQEVTYLVDSEELVGSEVQPHATGN